MLFILLAFLLTGSTAPATIEPAPGGVVVTVPAGAPRSWAVDITVDGAPILAAGACTVDGATAHCITTTGRDTPGVLRLTTGPGQLHVAVTVDARTVAADVTAPDYALALPIAFGGAGPGAIAPPAGGADGPVVYVCGVNYWLYLPFTDPLQPLPCP